MLDEICAREAARGWGRLRPEFGVHVCWALACVLSVRGAHAEAPSEREAPPSVDHAALTPRVRPPEPLELSVDYPVGATGEAEVVLELVVEVDGSVSRTEAIAGEEPFRSAALEAAFRFRFVPAEREGHPVAAKIRVQLEFSAPELPPPPASSEAATRPRTPKPGPPATSAAPPPQARQKEQPGHTPDAEPGEVEVTVIGERLAPDADSLTRAEARMIPGTFGDPLRAIEAMPGVAPTISGLPYFFVRGAPPGNVGYFVDGVRVPMLWHAFVGPSVLNPATIDKVTLHRGGYPARYGKYAGAIVTVDTVVPYGDYGGEASLRVVDGGIMQTLPLSTEGRSAVLVSGRYAYLGPVVTSLFSDVELGYWDYQVSSRIDLGANDRLELLALGASDTLKRRDSDASTRFHRLVPRYEHDFSEDSHLGVAVGLGYDQTGGDQGFVRDRLVAPRVELQQRFGDQWAARVGLDLSVDDYRLETGPGLRYRSTQVATGLGATRTERTLGSYVDVTWRPVRSVWVSPGLRADMFQAEGRTEAGIDPRIAARFEATPKLAFEHTLGLAHQSASFVPSVPGAAVTNINDGLQRSVQASSGVELRLPQSSFLSVTAFEAIYMNLADPLGTEHQFTLDIDQLERRVRGHAYGLEVYFKRPIRQRVGGMVAYTLSRSKRSYGRVSTLASVDRTHVLSATIVVDAGRRWLLGARNTLLGGLPTRRSTADGPVFDGSDRTDPFYRCDLRAEKRYRLGKDASLSIVMELLNATFSHEVTERSCNEERCTEYGVGPIVVPNVGAELRY